MQELTKDSTNINDSIVNQNAISTTTETDTPIKDIMDNSNELSGIKSVLFDIYEQLIQFVPNILGALLIVLIGMLLIRFFTRLLKKIFSKTGIDKFADSTINQIDFLSSNNIRIVPSTLVSKVLYYLLLLIIIVVATDTLQMDAVSKLVSDAINYLPSLVSAFLLLMVGLFLADFVQDVALAALKSLNVPAAKFVATLLFYFILLNVLMLCLEQAQINTSFITSNLSIILGGVVLAFAIGYGLASKDTMASHIGYFYNKGKIKVGHTVVVDGKQGMVVKISSTALTLFSSERNSTIIIPTNMLNSSTIEIIQDDPEQPTTTAVDADAV